MRAFRRKRRPGNRNKTKAEASLISLAKQPDEGVCIACLVWAEAGNMPMGDVARCCDWNHRKSGNVRMGHGKGYTLCLWHHKRQIEVDGWTHAQMAAHFGPSLMDGSALFHRTYGSDAELERRQYAYLGIEHPDDARATA